MTFLRFLNYEKPYIIIYLISFLISGIVFYTDSDGHWKWGNFFYTFTLSFIILVGFLLFRFQQNMRSIRQMEKEDYDSLSLEGEIAKDQIETLKKAHIREMNEIQNRHNEHYDFIVSWFHEVKTPIAVLRLLQQTELDAESVREEISKIENYVDQALYYAKLDSFNQDYDIQTCDVLQLTKETIKSHAKTFFSKKIQIDIQADALHVQSDPKWLQFIVNQVVTNCLKYTEQGGRISISMNETLKEKQLIIQDNGIGISPKDLPRIFNRGFTGETGRTHSKSTGMGLYLAQQLSNKLGHYITCNSKELEFTQFIIHFPTDSDPYMDIRKNTR